jgi:hypothetical protein
MLDLSAVDYAILVVYPASAARGGGAGRHGQGT